MAPQSAQPLRIKETSPLYDYWRSDQNDFNENLRKEKANRSNPMSNLFIEEPYKWEVLYQCTIREVIRGDKESRYALALIISTLERENIDKTLGNLSKLYLINEEDLEYIRKIIDKGHNPNQSQKTRSLKKSIRFVKILLSIFFNPYGLLIKRQRIHIYEYTALVGEIIENLNPYRRN